MIKIEVLLGLAASIIALATFFFPVSVTAVPSGSIFDATDLFGTTTAGP